MIRCLVLYIVLCSTVCTYYVHVYFVLSFFPIELHVLIFVLLYTVLNFIVSLTFSGVPAHNHTLQAEIIV